MNKLSRNLSLRSPSEWTMKTILPVLIVSLFAYSSSTSARAAEPLVAGQPILVPDSTGSFDFLHVDSRNRRLLAAHTGNNTLDVFDLDTGKLIKHVATGKAQGEVVDNKRGKYYVSVSAEKNMSIVDIKTLEKTGEVPLPGETDDMLFCPKNGLAY